MSISDVRRCLITSAVLALLAGCSGISPSSQLTSGNEFTPQSIAHQSAGVEGAQRFPGSFPLAQAKLATLRTRGINVPHVLVANKPRAQWGHVLFVSDYLGNVVQQFEPKNGGNVIATITDVVGPQGMDADRHGNLYVASQGTSAVNVYAPGTYTAAKILNEGNQQAPASVAVCSDGTVYVSNTYANGGNTPGSIQIFAPGATTPTGSIPDTSIFFSFFVSCDAAGNVWYDYLDSNFTTGVAEYVPTSAAARIKHFGSLGIAFPGGIRSLGKGLLSINDQSASQFNGIVYVFDTSNMAAGPISTITGFSDPVSGSWSASGQATWQADITMQRVYFATVGGNPQIKYSVGAGTLFGPVDALVFPSGNT